MQFKEAMIEKSTSPEALYQSTEDTLDEIDKLLNSLHDEFATID
jgi:hypothetical protein